MGDEEYAETNGGVSPLSGLNDNSPAIYRWVAGIYFRGESEADDRIICNRSFCRPFHGLLTFFYFIPSTKVLGYYRSSA